METKDVFLEVEVDSSKEKKYYYSSLTNIKKGESKSWKTKQI